MPANEQILTGPRIAVGMAGVALVNIIDLVSGLPQGLFAVAIITPDPKELDNVKVIVFVPIPERMVAVAGTLHSIEDASVTFNV